MFYLYADDADATYSKAVDVEGGRSLLKLRDEFYGLRVGCIVDRWNNQWWIATHIEDLEPNELQRRAVERRR